jgi:hypothetical protein
MSDYTIFCFTHFQKLAFMKKYICFLTVVFCCAAARMSAQTPSTQAPSTQESTEAIIPPKATSQVLELNELPQNMVSIDLLRTLGYFNVSYTRAITPFLSLSAQVEAPTNFLVGLVVQESGVGVRLEGRFNPMQQNFMGLYIAPILGFNSLVYRPGSLITTAVGTNDFSATTTWFVAGAVVGYQFAPFMGSPGLLLGFGGGAEVNSILGSFNGTLPSGFSIPNIAGPGLATLILPRLRVTFGYAW